jgi:diguanylate cyclase (GGDEF)-like protein
MYRENLSLIHEIELARELVLLFVNRIYAFNRLPSRGEEYYRRLESLCAHLASLPDLSDSTARLIAAFEAMSHRTQGSFTDSVRASQWALRLEAVAHCAAQLDTVCNELSDAPVRIGFVYQKGVRDAEEFAAKLQRFVQRHIGEGAIVPLPALRSDRDAMSVVAELCFVDGVLAFVPERQDPGRTAREGLLEMAEVLVHAERLEKRIVLIGEDRTDFGQLANALKNVPERKSLGLQRPFLETFGSRFEELVRSALTWRYPAPELDDATRTELQRCLAELRAQRAIDQVFCYRAYFRSDQWSVFQAIYEACHPDRAVPGTPARWTRADDVYEKSFGEGAPRLRTALTKRRFLETLQAMARKEYGSWGEATVVSLVDYREDTGEVKDNTESFASAAWGAETIAPAVMSKITQLLTEQDSWISRSPSELHTYLIHRRKYSLDDASSLFVQEEIGRWSSMTLDEKTGLRTAAARRRELRRLVGAAIADGAPVGALLVDLDDFKKVNDTFGHAAGDKVLADVAKVLLRACAGRYSAYREGGEELLVLMPNTTEPEALAFGERVRASIESVQHDRIGRVTVSVGAVSMVPSKPLDAESLFEAADQAMYQAKRTGKNRVCSGIPRDLKAPTNPT